MTPERVTKLIMEMEDNAWAIRNLATANHENRLRRARTDERWKTLFDVVKILTNKEYAETLWNIFITGDEDDGDDGEDVTENA